MTTEQTPIKTEWLRCQLLTRFHPADRVTGESFLGPVEVDRLIDVFFELLARWEREVEQEPTPPAPVTPAPAVPVDRWPRWQGPFEYTFGGSMLDMQLDESAA